MQIVAFPQKDPAAALSMAGECTRLFFHTVHTVNAADYSPEQLDAWAPRIPDAGDWQRRCSGHPVFLAQEEGQIVGFGDIYPDGLLDLLYVHAGCQGGGIGRALVQALERAVTPPRCYTVYASITARPFFERMGYRVVQPNFVKRGGVILRNDRMEKPV